MDAYNRLKEEILQINRDVSGLFTAAKSIPGMADYSFGEWEKTAEHLPRQLAQETIRVAIVGTIKSGKSTFLNSIFKGDYVKRGAGVITSIVTRVRSAENLRANLFFKSWDEVNADMEQALVLFPSMNWRAEKDRFDIRKASERNALQQALAELSADQLIAQDTRSINNVLLTSYLKGYDTVTHMLSSENHVQRFENEHFADHKAFVGDESLAVYLKDVLLEISSSDMKSNIEIADCQGSDSSNPLHLAMIQDYLLLTHLIIYVVSSRTGPRQADIRFLQMIKKMGILDNILFVVNTDFSEHDALEDLKSLVDRIREELAMIKPEPEIYTFSALYNLFNALNENLSARDRLRLSQWEAEEALTGYSNLESTRFDAVFYDHLARKRYALLLKNHVERLGVILSGLNDWIAVNRDILTQDTDEAEVLLGKIRSHQKRLHQLEATVKKSLGGAVPELKKKLHVDVNRFFDSHGGRMMKEIGNFINAYTISTNKYEQSIKSSGFSKTLYQVFQEFKQAIDTFITEMVNPEVIRFIQSKESGIRDHFESVIIPFNAMAEDIYKEYNGLSDRERSDSKGKNPSSHVLPTVDAIIQDSGLIRPPLVTKMQYSVKIKTEAMIRLGFYRAVENVKNLIKKSKMAQREGAMRALEDGTRVMKHEMEQSVTFHLKDYRENLKFSYLDKFVDAAADRCARAVLERFQAFFSDLTATIEKIGRNQSDKESAGQILDEMDRTSRRLNEKIQRIRSEIETTSEAGAPTANATNSGYSLSSLR